MSIRIALLLQEHFINYCRRELGEQWKDCSLTYLKYETLEQLQTLFQENKERFDGFLTSGAVPLNALRDIDTPPYSVKGYFGGHLENTYRILLAQILKRRETDPARIGIDYLDSGAALSEVLNQDRLPELVSEFETFMVGMSEKELEQMEKEIVAKYQRECRAGELDFIVTNFYSVVKALENEKIPCYYAYPSLKSLEQVMELCVKNIRLEQIRHNISAVIRITPDQSAWKNRKNSNQELELLALKAALLEYCRDRRAEPVMKDDFMEVELYLNTKQVQKMTEQFTSFDLPVFLEEKIGFTGTVSIGSGEELGKARVHAMQARDFRSRLGQDVCVYMDEKGEVHTLPLRRAEEKWDFGIPASYVEQVANGAHLSSETIYRVIKAMQTERTREWTSADLVRVQNFSLRIATRVLTALSEAGYAEPIGQKRIGNKGRPQNLYRIDLEYGEG